MAMHGDGGGFGPTLVENDWVACWMCQRRLVPRALFCHACGSLQPVHDLDPFVRMNVERRFDIDLEALDQRHAGLRKTLDAARFSGRGPRERGYREGHVAALDEAHETLRDPVRRARWLLTAANAGDAGPAATEIPPELDAELAALRRELDGATDVLDIDVLANRVGRDIEDCILRLAQAFRAGVPADAEAALARLDGLEAIAAEARARRQASV